VKQFEADEGIEVQQALKEKAEEEEEEEEDEESIVAVKQLEADAAVLETEGRKPAPRDDLDSDDGDVDAEGPAWAKQVSVVHAAALIREQEEEQELTPDELEEMSDEDDAPGSLGNLSDAQNASLSLSQSSSIAAVEEPEPADEVVEGTRRPRSIHEDEDDSIPVAVASDRLRSEHDVQSELQHDTDRSVSITSKATGGGGMWGADMIEPTMAAALTVIKVQSAHRTTPTSGDEDEADSQHLVPNGEHQRSRHERALQSQIDDLRAQEIALLKGSGRDGGGRGDERERLDPALADVLKECDMLEEYGSYFAANEVHLSDLKRLSVRDLQEMVPQMGPRLRLLQKLREVQSKAKKGRVPAKSHEKASPAKSHKKVSPAKSHKRVSPAKSTPGTRRKQRTASPQRLTPSHSTTSPDPNRDVYLPGYPRTPSESVASEPAARHRRPLLPSSAFEARQYEEENTRRPEGTPRSVRLQASSVETRRGSERRVECGSDRIRRPIVDVGEGLGSSLPSTHGDARPRLRKPRPIPLCDWCLYTQASKISYSFKHWELKQGGHCTCGGGSHRHVPRKGHAQDQHRPTRSASEQRFGAPFLSRLGSEGWSHGPLTPPSSRVEDTQWEQIIRVQQSRIEEKERKEMYQL
jgi:hypothetical protein